jgi:hypothetical protein
MVGFLLDLCLGYAGILAGVNITSFGWGIDACSLKTSFF